MLTVTLEWATASTASSEERGCCSIVRADSREGGCTDTPTIDERWEDSLLLSRIEVRCSRAWTQGAGGAPWEEPRARGGVEAAAAPLIHGGQLSGDTTSLPLSARAEEEEALLRAERAPFGTKLLPPRAASTRILVDAAQQGGIGGIGISIGIGGSVTIDLVPVVIPCCCSAASCSCRLAHEPGAPQVDTAKPPRSGERSEEPPTPSLTGWYSLRGPRSRHFRFRCLKQVTPEI